MGRLQQQLKDEPDVRLVSLTVDPANDTPQKLKQYAETYRAAEDRWLLLRGSEADVHTFVRDRLKLGVAANPNADKEQGNRVLHSPKLTLIDRRGNIRGFYDGTDAAAVDRLRDAARRLAGGVILAGVPKLAVTLQQFLPAWNSSLNAACAVSAPCRLRRDPVAHAWPCTGG